MPSWNMFDQEVARARAFIRDMGSNYGNGGAISRLATDSYKAQALAELARRLELESKLQEMQVELNQAISRAESAELEFELRAENNNKQM